MFQGDEEEEETDNLVNQVLDEIGINLDEQMVAAPGQKVQVCTHYHQALDESRHQLDCHMSLNSELSSAVGDLPRCHGALSNPRPCCSMQQTGC